MLLIIITALRISVCYDGHMELTINSNDYLNQPAVGYMLNTLLSESARSEVNTLQDAFSSELHNAVWRTPRESLHITLMDWLAPLVEYYDDKDRVFKNIYHEYNDVLTNILSEIAPMYITFNSMIVSRSAVAIVADENSTILFNDIRQKFLGKINLLPNTKLPPTIVHSTIIRFVDEIALDHVEKIANSLDFSFTEKVDGFQLVRETTVPMLGYSVIKQYPLDTSSLI
jgi:2'-5' RNA ligase